jgi:hypothetical protein
MRTNHPTMIVGMVEFDMGVQLQIYKTVNQSQDGPNHILHDRKGRIYN